MTCLVCSIRPDAVCMRCFRTYCWDCIKKVRTPEAQEVAYRARVLPMPPGEWELHDMLCEECFTGDWK